MRQSEVLQGVAWTAPPSVICRAFASSSESCPGRFSRSDASNSCHVPKAMKLENVRRRKSKSAVEAWKLWDCGGRTTDLAFIVDVSMACEPRFCLKLEKGVVEHLHARDAALLVMGPRTGLRVRTHLASLHVSTIYPIPIPIPTCHPPRPSHPPNPSPILIASQ